MRTVYHVTSAARADDIINNGFKGGWGDAGFGVYFYGEIHNAFAYRNGGGWDGELDPSTAIVIAVEVDDSDLDFVIPDPSWPNPEDYDDVLWFQMEDSASRWQPPREIAEGIKLTGVTPGPQR